MAKLRGKLPIHRHCLNQSPLSPALCRGDDPRLLWFNFAHLFSMSLLPLSSAWMAVSTLAPQTVAFYAAVWLVSCRGLSGPFHRLPRRRLLFRRRQGSDGRAPRSCRFRRHPRRDRAPAFPARPSMVAVMNVSRQRVVIVGGGFGGLSAARALARVAVDVTLIDRHNYHLFQPLLYQVATAALAPNAIAAPIRAILRTQKNATVLMETVTGIDAAGRVVLVGEQRVPYDFLIVATGARHSYFGHDDWEKFAPGIKTLSDALAIRQQILCAFEAAEVCDDPNERRRLLNFVLIGAGPTGVELAGAIARAQQACLPGVVEGPH